MNCVISGVVKYSTSFSFFFALAQVIVLGTLWPVPCNSARGLTVLVDALSDCFCRPGYCLDTIGASGASLVGLLFRQRRGVQTTVA